MNTITLTYLFWISVIFGQILADEIPKSFDARKQWPQCSSISEIYHQSNCSSWPIAVASAISDRICIFSNGKHQTKISAADLLTCCSTCNGCSERYYSAGEAWKYWTTKGIVTGGAYGSEEGCKSYPLVPSTLAFNSWRYPIDTPVCVDHCTNKAYPVDYLNDRNIGESSFELNNVMSPEDIQREIMKNGPVTARIELYESLLSYKKGVYQPEYYLSFGLHSVKIIGWGVEEDQDYWLVANSFGAEWGEDGFFKSPRGTNTLDIEGHITGGIPKTA